MIVVIHIAEKYLDRQTQRERELQMLQPAAAPAAQADNYHCIQRIYFIHSFRKVVDHYTVNGSTVNVCTLDLSKAFDKGNHSALLVKLMNRNVPVNLLMLLEYWFANSRSCVR